MPINRYLWKLPFREDRTPGWLCPRCGIGLLRPKKGSFKIASSADSRRKEGSEDWDPTMIHYSFSVMLECNNEECQEPVACSGHGIVEENYTEYNDGHIEADYKDLFKPEYFSPPLEIFRIPFECPEPVAKEIRLSFKLFFCDPAASANHIRNCAENILTDKGIKRFHTRKGKRAFTPLHHRIALYQAKSPDIAERLFAIKWLGNEASHAGGITTDDVLDAYDILETVLDDLYVGHRKQVKKKVSMLIKRKRPLSTAGK